MVQVLLGGLTSLFGGGAAAAGTAAATTTAAAGTTAASGISLASLLQGTATVLGIVSAVGAGNAEAAQNEMAASDAESEQSLETLQGISRRTSIRKQMADALGAEDVAYAASGVDLSFGTAKAARSDAYREADLGLTTSTGTEQTRISRLVERAKNYRAMAKQAKAGGILNALTGGADTLLSFNQRG
ncbi:MAG: hypothetical protein E5W19_32385 [Mesorhizobium sp.]|uniref:hypothetical protein n=1 Tax=Mesorhizobium sp. M8A.F.Ca.ET.021.01.1.1 TaxID=2496757 RepID=UPI000FCAB1BE|nr:hypothetical protein [Mesorhizobium sp. M8A.F.Ca.ET.021.01.1.1]RUW43973.1 hypothetical protein EOA36_32750 [Mesorhizobium sp. M8A.F.Ca.ET.021.01.1.1]TIU44957.1 MAG: hypothetical protein E5W19_32385 [Mesorhizobium sp.]